MYCTSKSNSQPVLNQSCTDNSEIMRCGEYLIIVSSSFMVQNIHPLPFDEMIFIILMGLEIVLIVTIQKQN
ncbi:hypothetical protein C1645_812176 [Glomus cerebriforme]|uniref:Uncharacterized protein n=1 Tax=Glomus cerebriforme TaxID=658196 RepID=A0A397TQY6_9GLOM|nr:hypothetical protein C1645_812176 [Glomus cerebriforme]